jgi:hypothetical protein
LKDLILHGFRASNYFSTLSDPSDLYPINFTAQIPFSATQVEQVFGIRSSQEPYRYNNTISLTAPQQLYTRSNYYGEINSSRWVSASRRPTVNHSLEEEDLTNLGHNDR